VVDFPSVIVSVGVTITIQSLYYALAKFPPIFRQETQLLQKAARLLISSSIENSAALKLTSVAIGTIDRANDILFSPISAEVREELLDELIVVRAKLIGLEGCKDPIAPHVRIVRDGLSKTIEQLQNPTSDQTQIHREALSVMHMNKASLDLVAHRSNEFSNSLADELEIRVQNLDSARFQLLGAATCSAVGILVSTGFVIHLLRMHVRLRTWETVAIWLAAWLVCGGLLKFSRSLADAAKSVVKTTEQQIEAKRKEKTNLPGLFFNEQRG